MGSPTVKNRVEHILEAIKNIKKFVGKMDEVAFAKDSKVHCAVQYQFLIIGEAIKYIDVDILERYKYPWHIPKSFRNFIIHEYHGVKLERIYYVSKDMDSLEKQMRLILKNEF